MTADPTPNRHRDHVAVVTGAASGIGAATAQRLAAEGAHVACLDLAAGGAAETATAIEAAGGTASAHGCDVSDEDSVAKAVEALVAEHDRIDIVCNVAGIGKFDHTHEATLEDWDRILGVNLTGTFLVCRASIPHLLETGGVIVNTSSTAGVMGQPYSAAYNASKFGVVGLTKALAVEYAREGIRANAICPGGVDTPIQEAFGDSFPEGAHPKAFSKLVSPLGFAESAEIAGTFAYVASEEARYMNGSIVIIDGGVTL